MGTNDTPPRPHQMSSKVPDSLVTSSSDDNVSPHNHRVAQVRADAANGSGASRTSPLRRPTQKKTAVQPDEFMPVESIDGRDIGLALRKLRSPGSSTETHASGMQASAHTSTDKTTHYLSKKKSSGKTSKNQRSHPTKSRSSAQKSSSSAKPARTKHSAAPLAHLAHQHHATTSPHLLSAEPTYTVSNLPTASISSEELSESQYATFTLVLVLESTTALDVLGLSESLKAVDNILRSLDRDSKTSHRIVHIEYAADSVQITIATKPRILETLCDGSQTLREYSILPHGWDEITLNSLTNLYKTTWRRNMKQLHLNICSTVLLIDESLSLAAIAAKSNIQYSQGEITGTLIKYTNVHNKPEAAIHDKFSGKSIKITLDESQVSLIKENLDTLVTIQGTISRHPLKDYPVSIQLDSLTHHVVQPLSLHSITGMYSSINFNSTSPNELVRRIRKYD